MHIISPRKVWVSPDDVAAFNAQWPGSRLESRRAYWFEFDVNGGLVDCDVPEHSDGPESVAMADDCAAFLASEDLPEWASAPNVCPCESFADYCEERAANAANASRRDWWRRLAGNARKAATM